LWFGIKNIMNFYKQINFLLGGDRVDLPKLMAIFLLASFVEILGIGMIAPFIASLSNPDIIEATINKYFIWTNFFLKEYSVVSVMSLAIIFIFVVRFFLTMFVQYFIAKFGNDHQANVRYLLMRSYQSLSYEQYAAKNGAEYIYNLQTLVGQYSNNVVLNLLKMMSDVVMGLFIIVLLAYTNIVVLMTLVSLLFTIVILNNLVFKEKFKSLGYQINKSSTEMIKHVHEGVKGSKEIKIYGVQKYFLNSMDKSSRNYSSSSTKSGVLSLLPRYLIELSIVIFIMLWIFIIEYYNGDLNELLPILVVFGVASIRLIPIAYSIATGLTKLNLSKDSVNRIVHDMKNSQVKKESINTEFDEKFKTLELLEVSYLYPGMELCAIDNINLNISAGDSIGIIGASGSGKTTILNILLGLIKPKTGKIMLNQKDLEGGINQWQRNIAYIPQDIFILDETFKANIAFGQSNIDDKLIQKAINKANLKDLVDSLPQGVDTKLGDSGARLSGGQRQRVALARAFYFERSVIIMDESTSALDKETEKEIMREVGQLSNDVTVIIVTHSAEVVKKCNRIYTISKNGLNSI
jgi:ATP-binding cassette, subfamily B, bacterial PglK